MGMTTRAAVVTAALLVGTIGGAAANSARVATPQLAPTKSSVSVGGCVIRLYTAGPELHANSTHTCVGVRSVDVTSMGRLRVRYTAASDVVGLSAGADETLAGRGIQVGVDGTSSYATMTLYDTKLERRLNLSRTTDYRRAAGSSSNIWFGSVKAAS